MRTSSLISEAPSAVHRFVVGLDGEGQWIARDEISLTGGVFADGPRQSISPRHNAITGKALSGWRPPTPRFRCSIEPSSRYRTQHASLTAILRRAGRGDTGQAKSRRDRTGDACRAYRACPHFARAECMQGGALSVDRRARPPLRHGTAFHRTNGGGRPARRRHAFGHALGARTHHRRHRPCWRVLDLQHRRPGGMASPFPMHGLPGCKGRSAWLFGSRSHAISKQWTVSRSISSSFSWSHRP